MFKLHKSIAKSIHKVASGSTGITLHFLFTVAFGFIFTTFLILIMNRNDIESITLETFKSFKLIYFMYFAWAIVGTFFVTDIYNDRGKNKGGETFGKARFSNLNEIKNAGLQGDGVVFGKIGKTLITKPPEVEGHVLVVGGTGTGKSRGVAIPTLLKWQGSALVMDIKGELSKISKLRRKGIGNVYIFDPENDGDCYDPIKACITIDQAQDLARTLIPLPEKGEPFWSQSAQSILAAFVFEGAKMGYKLTDIAEKLCTTPIADLVKHCQTHEIKEVRLLASITYELPTDTLGGVMGELKSKLITIASDPNIERATRKSDFSPETLESGATIYLKVSEHLLDQYKDLWTIIISQFLKYLSRREERKTPPVLIVLDEMPRLSKINGLTSALATLRSRNVHIMGVIQSMAQLDSIYGKDERKVIADNCRFKFVLSATDPETQKYFSDLTGQKTALAKGTTYGAGLVPNMSRSEQGTPLVRPEEWAMLEKPILLAPKMQPIEVSLAFWDKENF